MRQRGSEREKETCSSQEGARVAWRDAAVKAQLLHAPVVLELDAGDVEEVTTALAETESRLAQSETCSATNYFPT